MNVCMTILSFESMKSFTAEIFLFHLSQKAIRVWNFSENGMEPFFSSVSRRKYVNFDSICHPVIKNELSCNDKILYHLSSKF